MQRLCSCCKTPIPSTTVELFDKLILVCYGILFDPNLCLEERLGLTEHKLITKERRQQLNDLYARIHREYMKPNHIEIMPPS